MTILALPSKWGPVALVCKKCGKKLGGGFGKKGKHGLLDELRSTMRDNGQRRALRLVESGCLGVCPKDAVVVALSNHMLVVPEGTDPAEVLTEALR